MKQQILYINNDASHEFDFKLASSRLSLEYFHSYFCNHNTKKQPPPHNTHPPPPLQPPLNKSIRAGILYLKRENNLLLKAELLHGRGVGWFQGDLHSIPRSPSALVTHAGQAILHLSASISILIKKNDATQFPANTWLVFLFACPTADRKVKGMTTYIEAS